MISFDPIFYISFPVLWWFLILIFGWEVGIITRLCLSTLSVILNTLTTHDWLHWSLHTAHMDLCDQGSDSLQDINVNIYKEDWQHDPRAYIITKYPFKPHFPRMKTFLWKFNKKIINKIALSQQNPLKHVLKWHYILLYRWSYIHIYSQHVIHAQVTAQRRKNHLRFPTKHK